MLGRLFIGGLRPRLSGLSAWIALVGLVLAGGLYSGPSAASAALSSANYQRSLLSTVMIWGIDPQGNVGWSCSGTVVDPSGIILTNFHCVGHTDLGGKTDEIVPGIQHGQLYRQDGMVGVGLTASERKAPVPTYLAQYVTGSPDIDVAVLKIVGMVDQSQTLPDQLPLVVQRLGNSDNLKVQDPIHIFGYPGAGGPLITVTNGTVVGFESHDFKNQNDVNAFKTDAPVSSGNSGGQAVNDAGEDVGIPTFGAQPQAGVGVGGVQMINQYKPYIQAAINGSNGPILPSPGPNPVNPTVSPTPVVPSPNPNPNPNPATSGPVFGTITFGTTWDQNNGLGGVGTTFPSGLTQINAAWDYSGMANGMPWGVKWLWNGKVELDQHNAYSWSTGPSGTEVDTLSSKKGLSDGTWTLILYANNREIQRGSMTVGKARPQPPPVANGVVLAGQVVDANTQNPISGAVVVILKPGVTAQQWIQAQLSQDMVAAAAQTAQDGSFRTAPPVARGQTYSVLVFASGYQARDFEGALQLASDAPSVIQLDQPIALQSQ